MKKLILTAALTTAAALSSFGQGQVIFQNATLQAMYFNSASTTANKVGAGTIASQSAITSSTSTGVVDIGLYWSTAAFTDAANATLAQVDTIAATGGGIIAGQTSLAISGAAVGTQIFVQVYAWDSTYATPDAAEAAGAYFGAGTAGNGNTTYGAVGAAYLTADLTSSPAPGVPLFGTGAGQFTKLILLQSTPEPATLALGGLGAAALLMFRRRK